LYRSYRLVDSQFRCPGTGTVTGIPGGDGVHLHLDAAYSDWTKRNKKYVDSAHKMLDFKGIENQYKSLKKKDKHIPFKTCQTFIKRLRDPANDAGKKRKTAH
jgi:hypothetical protein